jgi:glutamyl-tRNA synthetase
VPALRVRAERERVAFTDRVLGDYEGVVDDLVIRRNDGAFAYNLAVVVDDADQGVREVVRGADLADATPGQRWLARRLGLEPPDSYAHVPLMLGDDGARLAKRHGAVTLAEQPADAAHVRGSLAASVGLGEEGDAPSSAELIERFRSSGWPFADSARSHR